LNLILIADTYPPANISAAQQLRDLAEGMAARPDDTVVVLVPAIDAKLPAYEANGNLHLVRAACLKTKDVGYLRRVIAEALLPWFLYRAWRSSPVAKLPLHGVVWYSPSIFLGPLVHWLKRQHQCRAYLILRDLFPDWAVDAGLMRKGLAYRVLKRVEAYQYRRADVIAVQTPANLPYLQAFAHAQCRLEVLPNWLAPATLAPCSIDLSRSALAGRKIVVYAGNMGIAQDMPPILEMVKAMRTHSDWGFVFVGRGSEVARLRAEIAGQQLDNVLVFDEIDSAAIPALFAQCHAGLLALDPRHKTHNIPGKFIAYLRAGLPVLARVNPGNDLIELIAEHQIGFVCAEADIESVQNACTRLFELPESHRRAMADKAYLLWQTAYSADACCQRVKNGLFSG
jgi:glycosyltransferase involved in cell wall biosynthesis